MVRSFWPTVLVAACAHHAAALTPAPAAKPQPFERMASGRELAIQAARNAYDQGDCSPGVPGLERAIIDDPDDDLAVTAATMLAECLHLLGDSSDELAHVRTWANDPRYAKLRARVPDLDALVKMAESENAVRSAARLEQQHDFAGCAAAYRAIYDGDPGAANTADVLFDAGACFEKAGDLDGAARSYSELVGTFPSSSLAGQATYDAILLDSQMGRCGDAVADADRFVESNSDDGTSAGTARLLLECLHQTKRLDDLAAQAKAKLP